MTNLSQPTWQLGVVSFLNARPLVHGLERFPDLKLVFDVPSKLADRIDEGQVDLALVPVVDFAGVDRQWQIISDACIGCDGETLTVRVFSRVEPKQVRRLHVDGDSHTSVVLASVIWRELYGIDLEIVAFRGNETVDECEAVLLIGDKVVHNTLMDYDIQTDLGSAWKTLTGLPFVFAAWAGPVSQDFGDLATRLSAARDQGVKAAPLIAADFGPGLNWPVALAERYLTKRLKFYLGERQKEAMSLFFELSSKHGLLPSPKELIFACP